MSWPQTASATGPGPSSAGSSGSNSTAMAATAFLRGTGAPASTLGVQNSFYERKDAPGLVLLKDSLGNWSFDSVPPEIVLSQAWEGQAGIDSVTGTGVANAGRAVFLRQIPADLCAVGSQMKLDFAVLGSGGGTSITITAGVARYDNQTLVVGGSIRKDLFAKNLANTTRFDVEMTFAHCEESFDYKWTYLTTTSGTTTVGGQQAGNSGLSQGLANSFVFITITENGTSSNGTTGTILGWRLALRSSLAAKMI